MLLMEYERMIPGLERSKQYTQHTVTTLWLVCSS